MVYILQHTVDMTELQQLKQAVRAAEVLQGHGGPRATGGGGSPAPRTARWTPSAVTFTDVGLPGMSGMELARRAVHGRPTLQVVIASGRARSAVTR